MHASLPTKRTRIVPELAHSRTTGVPAARRVANADERVRFSRGARKTSSTGGRCALQTRDGSVRFRCSSPKLPLLDSAVPSKRKRRGSSPLGSAIRRVRLVAQDAGFSPRQRGFDSLTRRRYPCRWIRRQVYEASQEGSIPSRGANHIALARGTGGDPPKVALSRFDSSRGRRRHGERVVSLGS